VLFIDPVCRMALDPERSHGQVDYEGRAYYFCSEDCMAVFRRDPDQFIDRPPG
jgi:Cu+-exporting ATPase